MTTAERYARLTVRYAGLDDPDSPHCDPEAEPHVGGMLDGLWRSMTEPERDDARRWTVELDVRATLERVAVGDEVCPSCAGSGWASIVLGGHGYAGGTCRCSGGVNWSHGVHPALKKE